jgi:hypothetical protein
VRIVTETSAHDHATIVCPNRARIDDRKERREFEKEDVQYGVHVLAALGEELPPRDGDDDTARDAKDRYRNAVEA